MRCWLLSAVVLGFVAVAYQGDVAADVRAFQFPSGNGDVNASGKIDVSDAVYLLEYLYRGGPEPAMLACEPFADYHNGDVNGSGVIDISDPIYLLHWLFVGGSPPKVGCPPRL